MTLCVPPSHMLVSALSWWILHWSRLMVTTGHRTMVRVNTTHDLGWTLDTCHHMLILTSINCHRDTGLRFTVYNFTSNLMRSFCFLCKQVTLKLSRTYFACKEMIKDTTMKAWRLTIEIPFCGFSNFFIAIQSSLTSVYVSICWYRVGESLPLSDLLILILIEVISALSSGHLYLWYHGITSCLFGIILFSAPDCFEKHDWHNCNI